MRVFAGDLEWEIIAGDTFDRESPPTVDARGTGLQAGLRELWRRTLSEGIRDSSSKTFTDFELWCGEQVSLGVQPSDNTAYAKLRSWIYGKPGPFEPGGVADRGELLACEDAPLLESITRAHERLLALEERGVAGWQAASAAGRIRACVDACDDPSALVAMLEAL
ncbi:MAG: hypothetical protein H0T89_34285 [Deltaproteobacteria bacterium]|nr:hypothetical protein [Deltaproteobacteria bacterium]MDQ3297903.1 hypothetical protein [Myxococcota bacterium]